MSALLDATLKHLEALVGFDTRNPPRAIDTGGIFDKVLDPDQIEYRELLAWIHVQKQVYVAVGPVVLTCARAEKRDVSDPFVEKRGADGVQALDDSGAFHSRNFSKSGSALPFIAVYPPFFKNASTRSSARRMFSSELA